jgi:hypothetical protein
MSEISDFDFAALEAELTASCDGEPRRAKTDFDWQSERGRHDFASNRRAMLRDLRGKEELLGVALDMIFEGPDQA